ncbi:MAG: catalase family peroxidase [Solirubrobacterales bacterium]
MAEGDLYEQLVDAMTPSSGPNPGRRAAHSKGIWCSGTFTATPEAAAMSRATVFAGEPIVALVRFSNASGNPESHDGARDGRGMAVKLRPGSDDDEVDILATLAPCFVARTPEDFLELLIARRPDPSTGEPDMEKLGAWLGAHPEAQASIQSVLGAEPPASFATLNYHSPHAFGLIDADGETTWIRYSWRPEAGEQRIPDDEARERGRDHLSAELVERLRGGTVGFELVLQLAAPEDPLTDPTAIWPDERETVVGGRLELQEIIDDPETGGRIDVFDPTRIADGIELSDDPVLHARPKAYSVSAYRRWDREPEPS